MKGGEYYNKKRVEAGLPKVKFIVAGLVLNTRKNDKLSSTHVREIISSKCSEEHLNLTNSRWEFIKNFYSIEDDLSEIW
jgi:phosphopantetheine adenylyltransferase